MSITWRTDYAMRITYELARLGDGARANIGVLADNASVPYNFARQIANTLARAGLLDSRRGTQGGFSLTRPAEQINLLEIFVAMGEKPTMSLCTHDVLACNRGENCPIHNGVWLPLDDMIERQLASTTLAECVRFGESRSSAQAV